MDKKIINKSSKDIPEELYDAVLNKSLTAVNEICSEWNLAISEYERIKTDNGFEDIITIGDRNYNRGV